MQPVFERLKSSVPASTTRDVALPAEEDNSDSSTETEDNDSCSYGSELGGTINNDLANTGRVRSTSTS